ncbi:glutathione peroxidase [Snodgrassella sp. CFCC 13594]|uniref:glutathione peroxidase n=1 Tax=Snodgrassella sp. CFCC 13594 TaxID=1775559 RepID=UPI00082A971A|nr:glutathione peroxidase [Snodgrassella sp. CFCC 13594]
MDTPHPTRVTTVYDFPVILIDGTPLNWADYRGKIVLLVNTASECGFTPQLAGLQQLQDEYGPQGFAVIGFPCNQFGQQEPGNGDEIQGFCHNRFHTTFALSQKIEVNGPHADPLWLFLQTEKTGLAGLAAIKWNFTKFLIGRDGGVLARFAPITSPEKLTSHIAKLLNQDK